MLNFNNKGAKKYKIRIAGGQYYNIILKSKCIVFFID